MNPMEHSIQVRRNSQNNETHLPLMRDLPGSFVSYRDICCTIQDRPNSSPRDDNLSLSFYQSTTSTNARQSSCL